MSFRQNRVPAKRYPRVKKGSLPYVYGYYYSYFLFPFQYSVTGQYGGREIPLVGRAFYDSHGVFKVVISVRNDSAAPV